MSQRDFCMARIAAADQQLSDCRSQLGELIEIYCYPDEDQDGAARSELIESVESTIRDVAYALEQARQVHAELSGEELSQGEFEEEEGEGDEGDDLGDEGAGQ